jgi:hypothetical protein
VSGEFDVLLAADGSAEVRALLEEARAAIDMAIVACAQPPSGVDLVAGPVTRAAETLVVVEVLWSRVLDRRAAQRAARAELLAATSAAASRTVREVGE